MILFTIQYTEYTHTSSVCAVVSKTCGARGRPLCAAAGRGLRALAPRLSGDHPMCRDRANRGRIILIRHYLPCTSVGFTFRDRGVTERSYIVGLHTLHFTTRQRSWYSTGT